MEFSSIQFRQSVALNTLDGGHGLFCARLRHGFTRAVGNLRPVCGNRFRGALTCGKRHAARHGDVGGVEEAATGTDNEAASLPPDSIAMVDRIGPTDQVSAVANTPRNKISSTATVAAPAARAGIPQAINLFLNAAIVPAGAASFDTSGISSSTGEAAASSRFRSQMLAR